MDDLTKKHLQDILTAIEEIESFLDRMGRKGKISKSDYDIAAYLFVSTCGRKKHRNYR